MELNPETITELWSKTYNTQGKPDWSHILPYYDKDIYFRDSIQEGSYTASMQLGSASYAAHTSACCVRPSRAISITGSTIAKYDARSS